MSYQGNQQYGQQSQHGQQGGFPGSQGRGADQGAADARHSQAFREDKTIQAELQPRDPQTGQFIQESPQHEQQREQQERQIHQQIGLPQQHPS